MQQFGRSPFDDPSGVCNHLLPTADAVYDLGGPNKRYRNIYVEGSVIGAIFDLANNQWLQARNAANTAFLKLLKADASNNTVINALTGKVINLEVNETSKVQLSSTDLALQAGVALDLFNNNWLQSRNAANSAYLKLVKADATDNTIINALTGKVTDFQVNEVSKAQLSASALTLGTSVVLNLADGADKNHEVATAASGTAYSLTNTSAALTFGTSSPTLVLDKAGTYLILGRYNLKYNGATFAAARTVTMKLRRTNNTPADLTGGSTTLTTDIVTTKTFTFSAGMLPPIVVTTANTNDIITIFGDVSVVPTAGSLDAIEANIIAVRLF